MRYLRKAITLFVGIVIIIIAALLILDLIYTPRELSCPISAMCFVIPCQGQQ